MKRNIEMQTTTISGNLLEFPINKVKANLLLLAINKEQLEALWKSRKPLKEIAKELHDINVHDVRFLVDYWELPNRLKAPSGKTVNLDELAKRIYEYMEPQLISLVDKRIEEKLG